MAERFPIDWTRAAAIPAKCAHCGAGLAAIFPPSGITPVALICTSRQHRIELLELKPHSPPKNTTPPAEDPNDFTPATNGEDKTTAPDQEA